MIAKDNTEKHYDNITCNMANLDKMAFAIDHPLSLSSNLT